MLTEGSPACLQSGSPLFPWLPPLPCRRSSWRMLSWWRLCCNPQQLHTKGRCLGIFELRESLCIWRMPSWWQLCCGATAACDAALSGLTSLQRILAALIPKAKFMATGQMEAHKCNLITMRHVYKRVLDPSVFECRNLQELWMLAHFS